MLNVDPSKCKREFNWRIKVYVERYKNKRESSGDKVIDHLSNFYVTRICERLRNLMTCYLQILWSSLRF